MIFVTLGAWFALVGMLIAFLRARRKPGIAARLGAPARFDLLALAALTLTTVACFGWLAHSYFLADDFILLQQAHAPVNWRGLWATRGGDGSFRPLGNLSYALSALWAGFDPPAWHWIGFLLHIANAVLVYALAAELGYSRWLAWLAASLFTLHAAHPEAVVWMAGRFDLLSTFFVLAALCAWLRSLRADASRGVWLALALAAMTAGLLSKESAYSFVLVAALLLLSTGRVQSRYAWTAVAMFAVITAALFVYRWHILGGIGGYGPVRLIPALKALWFRMWAIVFFPVNWTIPAEPWLAVLLAAYSAALAKLFLARAELGRLAFAAGFVILTAVPAVSQLLIGADLEKSRVLYLPTAGLCLMLAALAEPLRWRAQVVVSVVLLVFQGAVLWHNLQGWRKASEVVQSACVVVAECSAGSNLPAETTGLPRTLNGVYTFANGFRECVAMQTPTPRAAQPGKACHFAWDPTTDSLKAVE